MNGRNPLDLSNYASKTEVDLPSLEEVEALKRFWQKNLANQKIDKDEACICDDFIKKIKQAQTLKNGEVDLTTLSQMG
jgi:hypothetical protein